MSPDQENTRPEENTDTSQNQQNNGNIGREVDSEKDSNSEKDPNNDSYVIDKDGNSNDRKQVNESGIAENETNHWSGNYGQQSSNRPGRDEDLEETENYPKKGYNHVDNPGGTSEEDVNERQNSINLRNDDDDDDDPQDADASRL